MSDRAMAILHPHTPDERKSALKAAATEPDLFREIAERFPGGRVSDEVLTNYLLRNKFSPTAVHAAISAYKETLEFVGGLEADYDSPIAKHEEAQTMTPQGSAVVAPLPNISNIVQDVEEKKLGRWDFEEGGYVEIRASVDVDTEEALDMIETLVELRRKELKRKKREPLSGPEVKTDEIT